MIFQPNLYVMTFPMAFETGEQASYDVYLPVKARVLKMRSHVTKALAGTDAGTLTLQNSAAAAMTGGVCTHAASAALNDKQTATPTTNNTVNAGDFFRVVAAKTTAGGRVNVEIEYELLTA